MPHNEKGEITKAAEAIEKVAEAAGSDPPPSGSSSSGILKFVQKIRPLTALVTAVTALFAGAVAFLKTLDHSVTANAYKTLTAEIVSVQNEQQKNHEDLVLLRGYLNGLAVARKGADEGGWERLDLESGSGRPKPPTTTATGTKTTVSAVVVYTNKPKDGGAPVVSDKVVTIEIMGDGGKWALPTQSIAEMMPDLVAAQAQPPEIHSAAAPIKPPSFTQVESLK